MWSHNLSLIPEDGMSLQHANPAAYLLSVVDIDRLSLFTPKTPLGIISLTGSFYGLAGLGIGATTPDSLTRYGLLPPATLIAYTVARHSFDVMTRLLLTNVVAGTVCAAWSQSVVSGYLLKENFEDAGPRPGGSATYPEKTRDAGRYENARRRPDTWSQRLLFGVNTLNSQRNVLTAQRARDIPPFSRSDPDYVPSRLQFVLRRGALAFLAFLVVDVLASGSTDPSTNPVTFSQGKASLLYIPNTDDLKNRALVTLGQYFGLYVVTTWIHSTIAVLTVMGGIYPPEGWPPLYGSILDVWSLMQFWGRFWHSMLRYKLSATADWVVYRILGLRRGGIQSRYTHLFAAFAASGACHVMMDIIGPIRLDETYAFRFFLLQAVGISIEDGVQWIWRKCQGTTRRVEHSRPSWWCRLLGGTWVGAWLIWTTPMWVYPGLRAAVRVSRQKAEFLPFSLIGLIRPYLDFV